MFSEVIAAISKILIVLFIFFAQAQGADFSGMCVGVSDGDTISVLKNGRAVKIRLEGIDCPELGQDFGARARQFTSAAVFGKNVLVKEKGCDDYGRTLGRIIIGDRDLSLELVKSGLAWHYKKYSHDATLARAEEEARRGKIGLWSHPNPIPPWEYRRFNK
jgi:endonuclease YncB( thermonuclease family)